MKHETQKLKNFLHGHSSTVHRSVQNELSIRVQAAIRSGSLISPSPIRMLMMFILFILAFFLELHINSEF